MEIVKLPQHEFLEVDDERIWIHVSPNPAIKVWRFRSSAFYKIKDLIKDASRYNTSSSEEDIFETLSTLDKENNLTVVLRIIILSTLSYLYIWREGSRKVDIFTGFNVKNNYCRIKRNTLNGMEGKEMREKTWRSGDG